MFRARFSCVAMVVASATAPACFFELADPVTTDAGSAGTTATGATGGTAGAPSSGGSDSSVADACATCALPNAEAGCSMDGRCAVTACHAGFGDCDGDDENGCEVSFIEVSGTPVESLAASRVTASAMVIDGADTDWPATIVRHSIAQPCLLCSDQSPIPPVQDRSPPPSEDLSAQFRVAWNESSFYVLVEVHDDELVSTPASIDTLTLGDAVKVDAMELLISADHSSGGYGVDDFQLFFGTDGTPVRPYQSAPPATFAVKRGTGCYTIELKLGWDYLTQMQSIVSEGKQIGFTAAFNDWDTKQTDAGAITERQSHLFSKDPGYQYWSVTDGFGTLTLGP